MSPLARPRASLDYNVPKALITCALGEIITFGKAKLITLRFSQLITFLVRLAPINELLCLASAANALVAACFFTEGNAAGGNVCLFLELQLAFQIAAPHSADITALRVCDFLQLVQRRNRPCAASSVLKRLLIKSCSKICKALLGLFNKIADRNKALLSVIAAKSSGQCS